MDKKELEKRLIKFSISTSQICKSITNSEFGANLSRQLIRSSTSPALNYAEAQSAESIRDFVHKLKISLKELREAHITLKIIEQSNLMSSRYKINELIDECNQLISIFVASINTIEKKR